MYKEKTVGVVVPAYNEERLIGRTIETIPDFVDKIIIVDDGSTDRTAQIVEAYQQQQPERIILIRHDTNQGVGGAIASGYIWCRDADLDMAAVMAGDAQMDPQDLPALLDPVAAGEVDYTKGNRLISGEAWKKIPKLRYLGNAVLTLLTKIASGYWHVADSQSGYTVINKRALRAINWYSMYKGYGQPNDLLVRLNIHNMRVRDVEIKPIYGIGEKSGIHPLAIIPRLSLLIIKLFVYRMWQKYIIRDFHPLVFFYLLAFSLIFISIPLTIRLIWITIEKHNVPPINALALIFILIMGVQSLFFAMWFDMSYNQDLK